MKRTLTDAERIDTIREAIEAARGDWHEATALWSVGADLDWLLARAEPAGTPDPLRLRAPRRDPLLTAYGEYAGSAEGAGMFQTRPVQRLVEAVYEHLFPTLAAADPPEPGS